ncbi:hypothetical protein Pst134EA_031607 [Puccinia striiformis f. sp. tritici]|uniref:uncharacterized protein n=1 Tax=Puccinia striiformis f. sp. tritici TaxID=168172 RepID=UPI002008C52F|nr:uncharacterized protein Pst134EA_031607 [Puccinia striiformis f. sp. tritici]KAH9442730.1 hypothetical protein Pst134EA_031607 [Puccinia striiformis f. sp. tritici]
MNPHRQTAGGRKRRASRRPALGSGSSPLAEGARELADSPNSNRIPLRISPQTSHHPRLQHNRSRTNGAPQATFYGGTPTASASSTTRQPISKALASKRFAYRSLSFSSPLTQVLTVFPAGHNSPKSQGSATPSNQTPVPSFVQSRIRLSIWEISLPKCAFPPMGLFSE